MRTSQTKYNLGSAHATWREEITKSVDNSRGTQAYIRFARAEEAVLLRKGDLDAVQRDMNK